MLSVGTWLLSFRTVYYYYDVMALPDTSSNLSFGVTGARSVAFVAIVAHKYMILCAWKPQVRAPKLFLEV